MDRRRFMAAGAAGMFAPGGAFATAVPQAVPPKVRYFDYEGVTLRPGRFLDQVRYAREAYYRMSDDDMLKGFRRDAGLPSPGNDMKGWCRRNCNATFGQWLSGMARMSRARGDAAMRDKAIGLAGEWEKTVAVNGLTDLRDIGTYGWEKMSCGLLDLALYADHPPALETLARITRWASDRFDRSRAPATVEDRDGRRPHGTLEWYTLAENALRAYQATGDRLFLDFADLWHYDEFWRQFERTSRPANAALRHSYSHVNTFNSVAMLYAVKRDPRYLAILRNAYDWIQDTQAYASGGFGPGEWSVAADGSLGEALETRLDTAELPCGSWAGFKLSRYLTEHTGEARYGAWVETLLHNGIGAALPIQPDGRSFYYADYRVGLGAKTFFWDEWPCCSGTYIQAIADYHNILYQHDGEGLYVSQIVPSEVTWDQAGTTVTLTLDTRFPDETEARMRLSLSRPTRFKLRVRVPSWCPNATFRTGDASISGEPDQWAIIDREWHDGDTLVARLPMSPRLVPVDRQHPNRVAVMYGPVMMAQDARFSYPISGSHSEVLSGLHRRPGADLALAHAPGDPRRQGGQPIGELVPFHKFPERAPYRSYFDLEAPRFL